MWTRGELKSSAKDVLRFTYWKAFVVSLVLGFVGGGYPGFNFNWGSSSSGSGSDSGMPGEWLVTFLVVFFTVFIVVLFFFLAFRIFLGFPLEVGSIRYFKRCAEAEADLNELGFAFGKGRYGAIVKTMFWKGFLNFLWFLLLIIPGYIKYYAYSQVPFILADNPHIGAKRAVELSNRMTRGHKFRMFVLDLSFIGWILLGVLACFIGVLFVMPYINATKAQLYLALRQEALDKRLTTEEELELVPPPLFT